MIQRKQSLYLLLAGGIQTYFAFGTYFKYTVDGLKFSLTGSGIVNFENEQIQGNDKTLILSLTFKKPDSILPIKALKS